ncbi:MAG: riboflavin synthase [Xanthobacteraceae bacterium]
MKTVGIVDTMFARINMGDAAVDELERFSAAQGWECRCVRRTVPGFKDLAVECLRLYDEEKFDVCLAMGWVGGMPIDTQCAHEASLAIAQAQLMLRTHILEVFVHETETKVATELADIAINRSREHTKNALYFLFQPDQLVKWAGTGRRQGGSSVGPLLKP